MYFLPVDGNIAPKLYTRPADSTAVRGVPDSTVAEIITALPYALKKQDGWDYDSLALELAPIGTFLYGHKPDAESSRQSGYLEGLEAAAKEFDRRDKGVGGFYDPEEPAEIIRALKSEVQS